jgi:hypothetical protein
MAACAAALPAFQVVAMALGHSVEEIFGLGMKSQKLAKVECVSVQGATIPTL